MKLLVIDDHPLYIDGLTSFLYKQFSGLHILEASSVDQAFDLFNKNEFDLILIDFKFPDMNGLDLLKAFIARGTLTPLAIISGEEDPTIAKRALDLGGSGFIPKSVKSSELVDALKTLLNGGEFLPPILKNKVDQLVQREFKEYSKNTATNSHGVTERQLDVLKLMAKGYTNKRISTILNLSTDTVKEHIRNLFITLDVDNRTLCIVRARELGLDTSE